MTAPAINFDDALMQIATHMAASANVELVNAPRELFLYRLEESASKLELPTPKPASVLRIYDGSIGYVPVPTMSIQCMTTAVKDDDSSAMLRAQALYGALLDSENRPLRMVTFGTIQLNGIRHLQTPGQIGRDASDRAQVVFNFDVSFVPLL